MSDHKSYLESVIDETQPDYSQCTEIKHNLNPIIGVTERLAVELQKTGYSVLKSQATHEIELTILRWLCNNNYRITKVSE